LPHRQVKGVQEARKQEAERVQRAVLDERKVAAV